ncbi:MAG: SMP-30/gluconolactonase/LRE family protein [Opitutaceae bacterium]
MNLLKSIILAGASFVIAGLLSAGSTAPALRHWSFQPEMIFPTDGSLHRPEDGVVLADGRLIVSDQISGLRLVHADGSGEPFGRFAEAGYEHRPPEIVSTINGVTLNPSGTHILGADVFRGGLYRVDVATEAVEKVYQHPFGINMAREDRLGGIWFTQSTRNGPEFGERDLFVSVDFPTPDGALFYLPPARGGEERIAVELADGFYFANGLVLDEDGGYLYLSETHRGVLRFHVDTAAGAVSDRIMLLDTVRPDNLELDAHKRLWIALPLTSEIAVYDPATGNLSKVFSLLTPETEAILATIDGRIQAGESWLELFGPPLWEPAPGAMTGMILSPNDGTVYSTGLGNAIMRLER